MNVNEFRPHGTQVGHQPRCKCDGCARARAWNTRLRDNGRRVRRTDTAAAEAVRVVYEATGRSVTKTAQAFGYPYNRVRNWIRHEYPGLNVTPIESMHMQRVASSSAAVDRVNYSREKYAWRLGVLRAQGFDAATLERMAGVRLTVTSGAKRADLQKVTSSKWFALDRVWREIDGRMADPSRDGINPRVVVRMRTVAAKQGFHPLAAYENEYDLEPAALDNVVELAKEADEALYSAVETRIRAGMNRVEIRDQLHRLYPDVDSWEHVVARVQRRVRRAA